MTSQLHEDLSRDEEFVGPSDRSVGLVFAAVFAIVGLVPLLSGHPIRWWALIVAGLLLLLALTAPRLLAPLNRAWTKLGLLLHRIVNPVVMGAIYYLGVVPFGLVARAMGKDFLRLRPDPAATSYWIPRQPPGPPPESLRQQF